MMFNKKKSTDDEAEQARPNLSPFQGQKGMYHESQLKNAQGQEDFEDQQYKKYYANLGAAPGTLGTAKNSAAGDTSQDQQQKQQRAQEPKSSSKLRDSEQEDLQQRMTAYTSESPFGMRRRSIEHATADDAEEPIDVVRTDPFARRKVAQSHYHNTKPHGTHFETMKPGQIDEPVRAPQKFPGAEDQDKVPPSVIRFFAYPRRFILENLKWAPETVISTGKYKEPPQVALARMEKKHRDFAMAQLKEKEGLGNIYLDTSPGKMTETAEDQADGSFKGAKTMELVDPETEQLGAVMLNDFIWRAGLNSFVFFFIFFHVFTMFW